MYSHKQLIEFTKWMSSLVIIAGMALTVSNIYPLNMYIHFVGIIGWLVVALAWHERSIIMVNSVAACIFGSGIISSLL